VSVVETFFQNIVRNVGLSDLQMLIHSRLETTKALTVRILFEEFFKSGSMRILMKKVCLHPLLLSRYRRLFQSNFFSFQVDSVTGQPPNSLNSFLTKLTLSFSIFVVFKHDLYMVLRSFKGLESRSWCEGSRSFFS
jgi:hypothetical protein